MLTEKPAVWRCFRTKDKHGIGTNPGWGEHNTSWEGPEPEDLPAVGGTGDDPRKDWLSRGTITGEARAGR